MIIVSSISICFLSIVGFFLSLWIVISAPTYFLLPLGVGAPEISPLLLIINTIAFLLTIIYWLVLKTSNLSLVCICLICSLLGVILSSLPQSQFNKTDRQFKTEIETVLGKDYLSKTPQNVRQKMRAKPFVFKDLITGIPRAKVKIERDITFARPDNVTLKLNTYQPWQSGKYPTIIIIYGGAWRTGSPNNDEQFSCYLAERGYSVIAIDYRHAPKYKFPTQLEDVKTAFHYIYDNAEKFASDRDKIVVLGRSAGGHLALLAALQSELSFKGIIGYYPPIDLPAAYRNPPIPDPINTRKVLQEFIGGNPDLLPDLYQQASPINYVKKDLPPILLISPLRDRLVEAKYSKTFALQLKEKNNLVVLLEIPWAEHSFDAIFSGLSNQLVLYYTERFIAYVLNN